MPRQEKPLHIIFMDKIPSQVRLPLFSHPLSCPDTLQSLHPKLGGAETHLCLHVLCLWLSVLFMEPKLDPLSPLL